MTMASSTTEGYWVCPCGSAVPMHPDNPTPITTTVSLREPNCPFCRRMYQDTYRSDNTSQAPKETANRRRPTHPGQGVLSPDHAYPASEVLGEAS
jgi:hypothetical protein